MSWFRKKSKSEEEPVQETNVEVISDTGEEKKLPEGIKITVEDLFSSPFVCSRNLLSSFTFLNWKLALAIRDAI